MSLRGKQDGSSMIVACEMHVCLLGGVWGHALPPPTVGTSIISANEARSHLLVDIIG